MVAVNQAAILYLKPVAHSLVANPLLLDVIFHGRQAILGYQRPC
jgi:hypothetical protein